MLPIRFCGCSFSDNLVEEAAGEDSSGKSFRERDEDGFRKSEVAILQKPVDTYAVVQSRVFNVLLCAYVWLKIYSTVLSGRSVNFWSHVKKPSYNVKSQL